MFFEYSEGDLDFDISDVFNAMDREVFVDTAINSINPYLKEYVEIPAGWEEMINKMLPILFPDKTFSKDRLKLVFPNDQSFALFRSKYLRVYKKELLKVFKGAFKLKRCTPGYYIIQSFKE